MEDSNVYYLSLLHIDGAKKSSENNQKDIGKENKTEKTNGLLKEQIGNSSQEMMIPLLKEYFTLLSDNDKDTGIKFNLAGPIKNERIKEIPLLTNISKKKELVFKLIERIHDYQKSIYSKPITDNKKVGNDANESKHKNLDFLETSKKIEHLLFLTYIILKNLPLYENKKELEDIYDGLARFKK